MIYISYLILTYLVMSVFFFPFKNSVAQWLARRTRDPAVAGSIPTTAHVVIALGKQFTYISSVHPSAKWVPGYRQLKCIISNQRLTGCDTVML